MEELVMMKSVGVGSSGSTMINSVRSLPDKPRRTGKKKQKTNSLINVEGVGWNEDLYFEF